MTATDLSRQELRDMIEARKAEHRQAVAGFIETKAGTKATPEQRARMTRLAEICLEMHMDKMAWSQVMREDSDQLMRTAAACEQRAAMAKLIEEEAQ